MKRSPATSFAPPTPFALSLSKRPCILSLSKGLSLSKRPRRLRQAQPERDFAADHQS